MPQAANIVVKNATNVDKTFTLLAPAAGFGSVAEWALKEGATAVVWPSFTLSAHKTSQNSRRVPFKVRVPATYVSVATGLPVVSSYMELNGTITVPDSFPDDQKDDAVAYMTGLVNSSLVKSCLRDALPAT